MIASTFVHLRRLGGLVAVAAITVAFSAPHEVVASSLPAQAGSSCIGVSSGRPDQAASFRQSMGLRSDPSWVAFVNRTGSQTPWGVKLTVAERADILARLKVQDAIGRLHGSLTPSERADLATVT